MSLANVRPAPQAAPADPAGEPAPCEPSPSPRPRALGRGVFASPEQIVRRSGFLTRADRSLPISVAGPGSLAAMISLCRAGFERVECAVRATSSCADEPSRVLLIVGPMDEAELLRVLRRTGRLLSGGGGVLAVQLRKPAHAAVVRAALGAQGLSITSTLHDVGVGCLVTYTVEREAAARRQAS